MKKILLLVAILAMMALNGCTPSPYPQDIPMSGTSETKTDVELDTTVFGRLIENFIKIDLSTNYTVSDKSSVNINSDRQQNMKDIK